MWLFSYFLNFLKMVILELRYSGTEPSGSGFEFQSLVVKWDKRV